MNEEIQDGLVEVVQGEEYDIGIQVSESFEKISTGSILRNMETDSELTTITGIQSLKLLNVIVAAAKKVNVYQKRK